MYSVEQLHLPPGLLRCEGTGVAHGFACRRAPRFAVRVDRPDQQDMAYLCAECLREALRRLGTGGDIRARPERMEGRGGDCPDGPAGAGHPADRDPVVHTPTEG